MALLVLSFLLGGASRQHELRLAIVELAALPALGLASLAMVQSGNLFRHRMLLAIAAATVLIPLLQLVPLPPQVWTVLPGRSELTLALELAGAPVGWAPLSLTPDRTWRSVLALLPPLAMLLAILAVPAETRLRFIFILLAGVVASIALGAAQLASGGDGLYPWRTTDAGAMVGFFANRNHLATLCLAALPFIAVLGARNMRDIPGRQQNILWVSAAGMALVLVALAAIRSRTGVILAAPCLLLSLLAAWTASGRGRPKPAILILSASSIAALVLVGVFALSPILARFDTGAPPEGRFDNWPVILEAASNYLPVGSGVGSFDAVYRSVEPIRVLDPTFFNQAHNEYLETWLETGWIGIAAIMAFLAWFGRRAWAAWRGSVSTERDLQRAASIAILMILLHSGVDYPLRTVAIATVFALCCGILEFANFSQSLRRSRRTSPSQGPTSA